MTVRLPAHAYKTTAAGQYIHAVDFCCSQFGCGLVIYQAQIITDVPVSCDEAERRAEEDELPKAIERGEHLHCPVHCPDVQAAREN